MALLKYIGLANFRQLLPEDLNKAGVEVKNVLTFARHEVVKVRDDIAEAIHNMVGDEFEKIDGDVKSEVRDLEKDPQPTSAVPGQFVPQVTSDTTTPEETAQTTETAPAPEQPQNTPVQAEPVQQNTDQPTPSEQPASEVEGPGAQA